jgi:hypothetical protein
MYFQVYGSFPIPRQDGYGHFNKNKVNEFWEDVDSEAKGLSEACGCYIFALSAGRGALPWYVGKAEHTNFRKECFQPQKINHYNEVLIKKKGKPLLFLIPRIMPVRNQFANPTTRGYRDVSELERFLINIAIRRNKDLLNNKGTKFLRKVTVPGILNCGSGRPGTPATHLKAVLGL